jgi:hypothetical protein
MLPSYTVCSSCKDKRTKKEQLMRINNYIDITKELLFINRMSDLPRNKPLDALLKPDFDKAREKFRDIGKLENSNDTEAFLICHSFVNVSSSIRGSIQLGRSLKIILGACDHAIAEISHPETQLFNFPKTPNYSELFYSLQSEYIGIISSIKRTVVANKKVLETHSFDSSIPPKPL